MTLRAKLGLLFLGAVEVTFLAAVATFWAVQALRNINDGLTMIDGQTLRVERLLEGAASGRAAAGMALLLTALGDRAQELREKRMVEDLGRALEDRSQPGGAERTADAARRLKDYYHGEVLRLAGEARMVTRRSLAFAFGVVAVVFAGMVAYFVAIRVWLVRPIRALGRATGIIATGDLEHRIPVEARDEFGTLAASINRMASSLAEKQQRLLTAERFAMIGEMSAYVAHNIRNPLASIRATAQAEMLTIAKEDPQQQSLGDIVTAVDRLESWVGDLLRFSSPVTLDRQPEDLNALITRCADLARSQLARKRLRLELALAPEVGLVRLDRNKIEQVVSAVLSNAAEASPEGDAIRVVSVYRAVAGDGARASVRVEDHGGGIPRERLGTLFTMFATSKKSGTGLGLALAQKIVMAHDGQITVDSREGAGTTVEITLPATETR